MHLVENDAGDKIPGNDEKDVDADETAGERREPGMEQDHRHHRHGTQAVDVCSVFHPVRLPHQ